MVEDAEADLLGAASALAEEVVGRLAAEVYRIACTGVRGLRVARRISGPTEVARVNDESSC